MQLRDQIQALQAQLAQRPPIEAIQELRKEYSNLELILQGTQRENERAMTELERLVSPAIVWKMVANSLYSVDRGRQREKVLERELEKLAGSNWQVRALSTPAHSREAHHPFALLPCTPYFCRLTSRSHLPVSLAHYPRVPLQVYFPPQCTFRQTRPAVIQTQRQAWKHRWHTWNRYDCWFWAWRNASACGRRNLSRRWRKRIRRAIDLRC
jgi:chaperonin cofactor prefoldin